MVIAPPSFVYAQYYFSFAVRSTDMQGLMPAISTYAISVFFFASLLYRQVLHDVQVQGVLFHLLPEVIAIFNIVLTSSGSVAAGFFCLLIGECGLALIGAAFCCRSLRMAYQQLQSTKATEVEAESLSAPFLNEAITV